MRLFCALTVPLLLCAGSMAAATTFLPGEVMEVRFRFAAPPVCPGGPCDVLHVDPDPYSAFFLVADQASLFNGTTLLGTQTGTTVPNFRSATSLFNTFNSATIDFSSITNGTIDGLFRFSISGGRMEFPGPAGFRLLPARAEGPGVTVAEPGNFAEITSVTIIPAAVPEPGSALPLGAGALLLLALRRRRPATLGA